MIQPFGSLLRYYETGRHLHSRQILFFTINPLRRKWALSKATRKSLRVAGRGMSLLLEPFPVSSGFFSMDNFTFLNLEKKFMHGNIDWKFSEYGLLWNYHLNYFDFLHQENIGKDEALKVMHHFIRHSDWRSRSFDPYPVSLRTMNWIKFMIKHELDDSLIDESLFRQLVKLSCEPEYHLGANHLLENGFALLFGAFYFHNEKLFQQAEDLLLIELPRQILNDGAHIELSPMYHRIMLSRVLDCINLMKNQRTENNNLRDLLMQKASCMQSWLNNMTFRNGALPDFNDSVKDSEPHASDLCAYAKQLGITAGTLQLDESGYRKFTYPDYEIIIDAGDILPSYNPGHTHADMLSFCLNIKDKPVIVDCGTSTYEKNERRKFERSTQAHNTVTVNGLSQSDLWESFRVGKRSRIIDRREEGNSFAATLVGFTNIGIMHKRIWSFLPGKLFISDEISGGIDTTCKAYLHFHPDVKIDIHLGQIKGDDFTVKHKNHSELKLEDYDYPEGFNKVRKAKVAVISFSGFLDTEIIL
jgi:hypothetical protein